MQKSNQGIGMKGKLLHTSKEDFAFFSIYTYGKLLLVGRKTAESQPQILTLPGRKVEVISKNNPLSNFLNHEQEVVVIGGQCLYQSTISFASKLVITEVEGNEPADSFFPFFNKEVFKKRKSLPLNENSLVNLYFREA